MARANPMCRVGRTAENPVLRLLAEHGIPASPLRVAILETLSFDGDPLPARSVHERVALRRPVTMVATYRVLQELSRATLLTRYRTRNGRLHYGLQSRGDRMVLACTACGDIVSVQDQGVLDALCARALTTAGFDVDTSALCVSGVCARCTSARAGRTARYADR